MDTIITLPCEDLLCDAKAIFGIYVVTGAWFAERGDTSARTRERLAQDVADYKSSADKCISLPTHGHIILEFLNGRRVSFKTSEWAFISLVLP
jgi:hypothetical protein